MSVDYTRGQDGEPVNTGDDASMFAPTPIWEKNNRRRRGSGRARPSTAATSAAGDVTPAEAEREAAMSPNGDTVVTRDRTVARRGGSIAPAAIAIGVIVLAALAAAGWYATRSNSGMAQMTPGAPATAPATAITPGPGALAANTPSPTTTTAPVQQTTRETTTTTTTTPAASTTHRRTTRSRTLAAAPERPVTSPAATGAGVNAGATVGAPPTGSVNPPSSTTAPPAPSSAAPPPIAPAPMTPTLPNTPPPSSSPNPPADTAATTPQ